MTAAPAVRLRIRPIPQFLRVAGSLWLAKPQRDAASWDGAAQETILAYRLLAEGGSAAPTKRKMNDRQKNALDGLSKAVGEKGSPVPASFKVPLGPHAVSLDDWREELFATGVLDVDAANPRETFRQIIAALQARHLIDVRDRLVWRRP